MTTQQSDNIELSHPVEIDIETIQPVLQEPLVPPDNFDQFIRVAAEQGRLCLVNRLVPSHQTKPFTSSHNSNIAVPPHFIALAINEQLITYDTPIIKWFERLPEPLQTIVRLISGYLVLVCFLLFFFILLSPLIFLMYYFNIQF
jgi:hypothetical protein